MRFLSILRSLSRIPRSLFNAVVRALTSLRDNAARCMAVLWIAGMVFFGVVTVRRARAAAAAADAELSGHPAAKASEGPEETVQMLDVDQMHDRHVQQMHRSGLAAAGESEAPSTEQINAARDTLAKGIEIEGEVAGVAGKIKVVTKGGLSGWLKRNKNKKADPETLAWLRAEEAREGLDAYAGWADREDGSILNYAKDKKRARGSGAVGSPHATGSDLAAAGVDLPPGAAVDRGVPAPAAIETATAPATIEPAAAPPGPVGSAGGSGSVARGIDLRALGGAAVTALTRPATAKPKLATEDPTPAEVAALKAQLHGLADASAVAVVVRDHHIVLLLLADHLFEHAELTAAGKPVVRQLAKMLDAMPDRAFLVAADADSAMELASFLAINGLDADRMGIQVKDIDPAIALVEIEILPIASGRLIAGGTPH